MLDILKYLLSPSNFIVVLLVAGTLSLFFGRLRKLAIILVVIGIISYITLGAGPVSYWLIGKLEHRYPALNNLDNVKNIDTIVVLAGHAEPDPCFPISSVVSSSTAFRLMEATRLRQFIPGSTIVITGAGDVPNLMKEVLVSIGIPGKDVITENYSLNTFESAANIRKILGPKDFILVTSAGHMPRSILVFRKAGMNPIPAPTDYMAGTNIFAASFLPTPLHLMYSDLAVHEYIGMLWYKITGRL
jgi:uncharacterized SAM-binding protein YcdF (DUF218 family)